MGVRLVTVEPERVVAEMAIRAELCTWRESTTRTIWQVASRV
ncbi:MAG: hypothetical protein ABI574_19625 [Burkholderiales bacterium]